MSSDNGGYWDRLVAYSALRLCFSFTVTQELRVIAMLAIINSWQLSFSGNDYFQIKMFLLSGNGENLPLCCEKKSLLHNASAEIVPHIILAK